MCCLNRRVLCVPKDRRNMSSKADLRVGILAPLHLVLGKYNAQDREIHLPLGGVICAKNAGIYHAKLQEFLIPDASCIAYEQSNES